MNKKEYHLYVLLNGASPIYVGVSTDVKRRVRRHRKDKCFKSYYIIKSYKNKKEAYAAENALIRFNGLFDIGLVNAKHVTDVFQFELNRSFCESDDDFYIKNEEFTNEKLAKNER